jgi:hypothetical protein
MQQIKYFLLLLVIFGCNTPQAVYDYDEKITFSNINTYQIYPDLVSNLSQLDEQRLITVLAEELAREGLSLSENPQIYVNFHTSEYQTASNNSLGIGVGGTGRNVGVGVSGGIPLGGSENYYQITFDFIDAQSDALIWQAIVDAKFDKDTSPQKREERLRAIVQKALKGFPPKK